jgi:fimbrial isopeptide formation D2 family protein/uncharacterized repeat protein (TIGR01451 family)
MMNTTSQRGWLCLLAVLFFSLYFAEGTQAQVTITRTSAPKFYIDSGTSPQLLGTYTSYQITNTGVTTIPDVWVGIGSFTGGVVSLATNEDGVMHLGTLTAGQTKTAFFYLQASGATTVDQTHTISVYPTIPPTTTLATASFTFTDVEETIAASANKVTTTVAGPNPASLGGIMTITVTGETGTIGSAGILSFTPASYTSWRADAYEMIASSITLPNSSVLSNQLYTSGYSGSNGTYTLVYTFRAVSTTIAPTTVSPIGYISSGTQIKHTSISNFATLAPIQPAPNTLTLTKLASPTNPVQGGTVTYTLRLANSGSNEVSADALVDTLPSSPASPTYVTGSSTYNGVSFTNPTISGSTLTWTGTFTVPAGSSRDFTFQVTMPTTSGTYLNTAIAQTGSTQIDTTLSTSDNVPASVSVSIGPADLTIAKTHTGSFIQGQTGITYTVTVTNSGLSPTSGTVTVADTLPTGLTPTAASGTGWSCSISSQTATCTRNNALAISSAYPTITITADVATNAAASLTNTVTVSGGGETNTSNSSADDVTTIAPPPQAFKSVKLTTDTDGSGTITGGDTLTWTIWYKNVGSVDVTTFQINDPLPSGVTITSSGAQTLTVTGTTSASKNNGYTGAASGLVADLLASAVTFKAGDILRFEIPVTVNSGIAGTLSNQATGTGGNIASAGIKTDNVDSTTSGLPSGITVPSGSYAQTQTGTIDVTSVTIVTAPNVALVKAVSPTGQQLTGTDLSYSITFSNVGTASAQQMVLTDEIPSNTDFKLGSTATNAGMTGLSLVVEYSNDYNALTPGAATWAYTPTSGGGGAGAGYDRYVLAVRWRVTIGTLSQTPPNHTGNVGFSVQIR